uniref:F-box domain-containing protein n=1 Tax=Meloidogyne incognita TaxID=6306 RepID=A0A914LWY1_MELIC
MLYYFPNETKLDIFKCLSYQQLLAFKLTNVYFRDFINKYEGNLAKEKFEKISIGNLIGGMKISRKFIKQVAYTFDFSLTEEPEEKVFNIFKH